MCEILAGLKFLELFMTHPTTLSVLGQREKPSSKCTLELELSRHLAKPGGNTIECAKQILDINTRICEINSVTTSTDQAGGFVLRCH